VDDYKSVGLSIERVLYSIAHLRSRLWQTVRRAGAQRWLYVGVLSLLAVGLLVGRRHRPPLTRAVYDGTPTVVPTPTSLPSPSSSGVAQQAERHAVSSGTVRRPPPTAEALFDSPLPLPPRVAQPRDGVITYTVHADDTLASIAERFGLHRETLVWSNRALERDPDVLYAGQVLNILPCDGVYYTVQEGDTLAQIADRFDVAQEDIVASPYNDLSTPTPAPLAAGRRLVVPGGVKPFEPRLIAFQATPAVQLSPPSSPTFVWPAGGYITQGYWNLHRAIDIGGPHGDTIVAADSGTVVYAEWERSGYGYLVIVDHHNGYTSYYGHLYGYYVDIGDPVERGQPLGARGTTGRSTGPHVHFEIRKDGVHVHPLDLLPQN
jgi:LysM repeat protein